MLYAYNVGASWSYWRVWKGINILEDCTPKIFSHVSHTCLTVASNLTMSWAYKCLFPSTGSMCGFGFWRFEWICDAWIWRVTSKTVGRCDQGYPIENLRWWPDYKIERIKMLEREVREEREVRKWWYQQQSQESNLGSQQLNWWMRYTWLKGEEGPTTPLFDLVTIRIPNFTAWPSMHGHLWGHAPSPILSPFILKIIASKSHFVDNFSNSGFPINSSLQKFYS